MRSSPVVYDRERMATHARTLVRRHRWMIVDYILIGAAFGYLIGAAVAGQLFPSNGAAGLTVVALGCLTMMALGFHFAERRVLAAHMEADRALWACEIERRLADMARHDN